MKGNFVDVSPQASAPIFTLHIPQGQIIALTPTNP